MNKFLDSLNVFKHFGSLPPEYNRRIHGHYDPARYYGKPDTPFGQVKLGELASWVGRRDWTPLAMIRCCARSYYRWLNRFYYPRNSGAVFAYQHLILMMVFFYCLNIRKILKEHNYKYH